MIRVVINKEGEIFADGTGKQQGRGAYVSKDVKSVEDAQKMVYSRSTLMKVLKKLDPVYKEVIRLIYREEIPK